VGGNQDLPVPKRTPREAVAAQMARAKHLLRTERPRLARETPVLKSKLNLKKGAPPIKRATSIRLQPKKKMSPKVERRPDFSPFKRIKDTLKEK
jgi:hypothetical protein